MHSRHAAIVLPLLIVLMAGCARHAPRRDNVPLAAPSLIRLTHGRIVLTLAPRWGGRVVGFQAVGGPNLLDPGPAESFREAGAIREPRPDSPYADLRGHTVWVSPQSDWWAQQDLLPAKRDSKSRWPPDPFLEQGRAEIVESSPKRVRLRLPASPSPAWSW
jgi:hypothetical protein